MPEGGKLMVSEERTELGIDLIDQSEENRVLDFPTQLISIPGNGMAKADRLRGVTRSLVVDALDILEKMHEDCQKLPELQDNYYQLYHCLDFLKRFCDGRV
jgi:hypothetical protein